MGNFNCYVRIYLPLDSNGKPQPTNFGQYDLQIDSNDGTEFKFDEHTPFLQPVISYGGINGAGYVKIFDASDTRRVFTSDYLLCKYHFTATSNEVASFINYLQGMVEYNENHSSGICPAYRVTTGPFQNYTASLYNCFGATAIWCRNCLGMDTLYDIYTSTAAQLDHMTYAAWELFDSLHPYWRFTELAR